MIETKQQLRVFSSSQLRSCCGEDNGPIYLSIKGLVYDVSSSRHLYGPGGPYHIFAGKEISRALALFSLSEKDCNGDLTLLDPDQLQYLEEWIAKFNRQYTVVGKIMEPFWQRLIRSFF